MRAFLILFLILGGCYSAAPVPCVGVEGGTSMELATDLGDAPAVFEVSGDEVVWYRASHDVMTNDHRFVVSGAGIEAVVVECAVIGLTGCPAESWHEGPPQDHCEVPVVSSTRVEAQARCWENQGATVYVAVRPTSCGVPVVIEVASPE